MRRGTLEFCILLLIRKKEKMYVSDLLKELKSIDLIVVDGTAYPLLNRLKDEGLLTYIWEESKAGPPRKYFSITQKGIELSEQLATHWKNLEKSINSLL